MGERVPELEGPAWSPVDFVHVVSSDVFAAFELELGGDVFSVEEAVVPLEEGGHIFGDEAHDQLKNIIE